MAAWGSGDPRWLVEHRDDGRNVNGWHWEEKCILAQVKQRLTEMFSSVAIDLGGTAGTLTLTCCRDITGEASVATRKGNKRLVVYDLKMTIDWETLVVPSNKTVKGSLKVEEFGSASDEDDYLFEATTTASSTDEEAAKKLVLVHGKPEVVRRLAALAQELQNI